jgi:plastocyanin
MEIVMKVQLTLFALGALASCEGEPPVAPQNPIGQSTEVSAPAGSASADAMPEPAPGASTTPSAPTPVATSSDGGALTITDAAASVPVPSATMPHGNIVGSVSTQPASLRGQAVVYLEDGPTANAPSNPTVTIANHQMNFIPYVSVVVAGGKVVFTNLDPFPHNVFSPDGEKFNMGTIPQNAAHFRIFKTVGAYSLLCNLHPGMLCYVVVTPSAWFAKTDGKGKFQMKGVPSGTYELTAWAPRQKAVTQSVVVVDGDANVDVELHR